MSLVWRKRYALPFFHFPQTPILRQGSGKTLAYGLPVLQKLLLRGRNPASKARRTVRALILAPTRELALQISSHLNACLNEINAPKEQVAPNDPKVPKSPPLVSVVAIVGGMSSQKQKRVLSRGVDVLVATPGRLWDIMQEVCNVQHLLNAF
jgi:ATP-dependent RNA helicase DDX24/MAK5